MLQTTWPDVIKTAIQVLGPVIAIVIGALLTRWFTRSADRERLAAARVTHAQEKVWEHRREAYSAIIGKLHQFSKEADDMSDSFSNCEMDPMEFYCSPGYHKARAQVTHAFRESRDLFDAARLIISDDFEARYIQMRTEVYEADDLENPPEQAFTVMTVAETAYSDLLQIAKREIAPKASTNNRRSALTRLRIGGWAGQGSR